MGKTEILFLLALAAGVLLYPFAAPCQVELRSDEGQPGSRFGNGVSLWGDLAVVGAPGKSGAGKASGAAYLFQQGQNGWNLIAVLEPDDGEAHLYFGHSVAISGEQIIIGAFQHGERGYGAGAAYIFEKTGAGWSQTARLTANYGEKNDSFGYSVAISPDTAIIGAYREDGSAKDSGAAYIFKKSGTEWYQSAKIIPANHDGGAGDGFGRAVAIDGNLAAVGALRHSSKGLYSGAVYLFRQESNGWNQEKKLTPDGIEGGDFFGESVSLSGGWLIAGASGDDDRGTDAGAAYLFNGDSPLWSLTAKLTPPDGGAGDHFGRSVSLSGAWAAVGADGKDALGLNSGAAYLFEGNGVNWQHRSDVASAAPGAGDRYGSSISLWNSGQICNILAGSPGNDLQGSDAGAAYVITHGQSSANIRVSPTELTLYTTAPTSPEARARASERNSLEYARAYGLDIPESVRSYWRSADIRPPELPPSPSLPADIDWSPFDSPPKSQGSCGSCWIFAAAGLVENLANQAGIGGGNVDLSEQAAVSCIGKGCGGAWAWDAFDYIRNEGLPPEECYPYISSTGSCEDRCQTPQYLIKVSQFTPKGGLWQEDQTPQKLKEALQSGPLAVCMRVPDDGTFEGSGYRGGVYDYNGGEISWSDQGHVVLLVGYDDAQGYFKVKNSWGPQWGEGGYFRISYDDVTDDVKFGSYASRAQGVYIDGQSATVTIYNEGGETLWIESIQSSDSWLSFSPSDSSLPGIPPNGQEVLNVFVTQTLTEETTGTITIRSNDHATPLVSVDVHAVLTPPGKPLLGNINGDRLVDLEDALIALRIISGIEDDRVQENYADSGADVNGDGRVGPEEILFILRQISQ